jgi:hypothetical protein
MLFVVIDFFIAALAACLGGWLIRSGGQRRRPRRRRDPPACVWRRVLGGFGGRPLGRAQPVRSCLHLAAWLASVWVLGGLPGASCWWRPRRWRPRCCGTGGRGWVGGWVGEKVGGQAAMQFEVDILLLMMWWQLCAAAGRRGWAFKLACMFVRRCWRRPMYGVVLLLFKIATAAAAALVC